MADVTIRLEDDRAWLRLQQDEEAFDFGLNPDLTVREVAAARDELERVASRVQIVHVLGDHDDSDHPGDGTDWGKKVTTCPCGRRFPDTGLSGLGKHVSSCPEGKDALILAKHPMTRIYRPVVEALYDLTPPVFAKKQARQALLSHGVDISDSGLRGHIKWLVEEGFLEKMGQGRRTEYRFINQPPTSQKEVTNT